MQQELESGAGYLRVENPEDGSLVDEIAISSVRDIDSAIAAGMTVLERPRMPTHERRRILTEAAGQVHREADEFARLIATEGIKTIREARSEVARCVTTLRLSAQEAGRPGGDVLAMDQVPAGLGKLGFARRVPAGLVVAITPFNDPLNLVAHKVGPAIAAGTPIVLKPHEKTPLSAIRLHKTLIEAGLPKTFFQLVHGGPEAGAQLVSDPRPRIVSFTGGRVAGQAIAREAGFKQLLMELGGVGVVAVAADADIDAAAAAIHSAAFAAAGQNCLHAQRILVDRRVASALRRKLLERATAMKTGPKLDESTDMGCCIDIAAAQRVIDLVERSIDCGADLLLGGFADGTQVAPTWLYARTLHDLLAKEEAFGPVSVIEVADGFREILARLRLADDAPHVSVFTASLERAMAVHDIARAAAVLVNESTDFRIDAMPFGGAGRAGLGREGVRYAVESLTELRMMIVQRPLQIVS